MAKQKQKAGPAKNRELQHPPKNVKVAKPEKEIKTKPLKVEKVESAKTPAPAKSESHKPLVKKNDILRVAIADGEIASVIGINRIESAAEHAVTKGVLMEVQEKFLEMKDKITKNHDLVISISIAPSNLKTKATPNDSEENKTQAAGAISDDNSEQTSNDTEPVHGDEGEGQEPAKLNLSEAPDPFEGVK